MRRLLVKSVSTGLRVEPELLLIIETSVPNGWQALGTAVERCSRWHSLGTVLRVDLNKPIEVVIDNPRGRVRSHRERI